MMAHKELQSGGFAASTAVHAISEVSDLMRDQQRAGEKPSALEQLGTMERCMAVNSAGQAMAARGQASISALRRRRSGN